MLNGKKALLLVGSNKTKTSTSEALGDHLLEGLNRKGYVCEKFHVVSILKKNVQELLDAAQDSDIIIISFPLYVDNLPAPVIKSLELITENRKRVKAKKKQAIAAIANLGFPEAYQCDTALRILKNFAYKNNFQWLGGLEMGFIGPLIAGRPIKELGFLTRHIVKALDIAAEDISNNKVISSRALRMMSKSLFPYWLCDLVGNWAFNIHAKQSNKHLYDRPYSS